MPLSELAVWLEEKKISSVELTQAFIQNIKQRDSELNTYITVTEDVALAAAKASDARRAQGQSQGPLDGIPFALKDNYSVDGIAMTCASKMLQNYQAPYTATAAANMLNAGAVLLGKNNMDEFAIGSSTENSAFGPVKNPLDPTRVPGGSSGGSAACVAAGEAVFALGSDTGGSVRLPAACCGIVGMKPTYGLVSRRGIAALASSLDQAGILARSARDTAIILNHLASYDRFDSMSCQSNSPDYTTGFGGSLSGKTIGLPKEFLTENTDPLALAWVEQAVEKLRAAGAQVKTVSLPHSAYSLACYYIIMSSEFSTNMGRFDGLRFGMRVEGDDYFELITNSRTAGLGPEVKTRILFGAHMLSEKQYEKYYVKAMQTRRLIFEDYQEVFKTVDCLLSPVQDGLPFQIGSRDGDSVKMAASDQMLIPANLAGLPALSLPFGQAQGLPGAVQLVGPQFSDARLLAIADVLEREE